MVTTGRIWAGICSAGLCVAPAPGAAQSDATSDYELSQVGASTAAGAASQAEKPVARSLDDTTFVSAAWQAGAMIVSAAEIAVTHTTDSGIRQVAQVVKIEQSAANGQLAELARQASIRYDAAPAATLNTTLDKMRTTIGIGFDEAYLPEAITEQKSCIRLFERAVGSSNLSLELRDFATATLPSFKAHLQSATDVATSNTQLADVSCWRWR